MGRILQVPSLCGRDDWRGNRRLPTSQANLSLRNCPLLRDLGHLINHLAVCLLAGAAQDRLAPKPTTVRIILLDRIAELGRNHHLIRLGESQQSPARGPLGSRPRNICWRYRKNLFRVPGRVLETVETVLHSTTTLVGRSPAAIAHRSQANPRHFEP
jgi:hypothetical protein